MSLGTFRSAAGGVTWSRGRGAGKITVFVDFKTLERWARRTAQDEARLWNSAFASACSALKKRFYAVVRNAGGVEGVPKFRDFEEFTKELRSRRGSSAPMGGILAERESIGAWKRNGWQYIGWKDYLAPVANRFQDGGDSRDDERFANPNTRYWWHREGIRTIPRAYAHNPREVLPEPFGSFVKANLDEWAESVYFKRLARLMAQNGALA